LRLGEIIKEAKELPLVSLKATTAYQENISVLRKYVDDTLSSNPSINKLIGNNPLQVMYDNHGHHAAFMATVFSIGNYELLARTVPWVYRAYSAHKFSYDYFPLELKTWIQALEKHLTSDLTEEIKSVYAWMIKRHENMIYLSQTQEELELPISEDWLERKNSFLTSLLEGDHKKCLEYAKESISTSKDIEQFYLHIIQPVMYEIGMLWERGTISVAQEHLASAIVGRVMASTSMLEVSPEKDMAKVVITSAPNEFHEIGAWMISDILEHEGWKVRYLGANTPTNDLLELLRSFQPKVLALSVTMPFNILKANEIIKTIKGDEELNQILVIVGGRAFNDTVDLWRSTGADFYAANAQEAKALLCDMEE
jgi:methanogenic corrinoid protein MtbC1